MLVGREGHRTPSVRQRTDCGAYQRMFVSMNMTLSFAPLVALLAGILILVVPRLLNYIVAIYLIVIGLLGLFGDSCTRSVRSSAHRSSGGRD
jgi:cytochrome c biogenesis protein CcdA